MTDNNKTNIPVTSTAELSAATPSKTSIVLKTLKEQTLYVNEKLLSDSKVANALDRELNAAGITSNLYKDYAKRNIASIAKGYGGVSLEDIMRRAGFDSTCTRAVTETLEPHRQKLLTGGIQALNYTPASKADHSAVPENTAAIHENATTLSSAQKITKLLGKLSLAAPVINSISIVADYKQAMERVQPYVDKKQMDAEAARDYAVIIAERQLEQNMTFGLSHGYGDFRLVHWVKNHPEISDRIMQKLDLGEVREMQNLISGKAPES